MAILTLDSAAPPWAHLLVAQINRWLLVLRPDNAVAITGGTINGTTIGATTPAAGSFTTLTASGNTVLSTVQMAGLTCTTLSIAGGAVIGGTYTPTLFNTANVGASTALQCQYIRVGNVVNVSGGVTLAPTLLATLTTLGMSLPIASTLSSLSNLGGTAANSSVASNGGPVFADTVNNRATLQLISVGTGSETFSFDFQYLVT